MAVRDREWPGYSQWYCCPVCRRLWTYQGHEIVTLDPTLALGPPQPTEGTPPKICPICEGLRQAPVAEI